MQIAADNWDDLRFLLAVARGGSFLHAGRTLRIATSTVQRRFGALERRLGTRLGDRTASGIALTSEGRRLFQLAEDMEARIASASRDLGAADTRLAGRIRVTAGDGFGPFLLEVAAAFRAQHPDVSIDLALDHRVFDLARREADIGLRNQRPTAKPLVARRLGELGYGLYASEPYLRGRVPRSREQLDAHSFIGLEGPASGSPDMRWLLANGATRFAIRTTSIATVFEAALAGQGIAALPHALARRGALRRVLPEAELPALPIWLVMHRDLRAIERVRLFAQAIGAAAARELARDA